MVGEERETSEIERNEKHKACNAVLFIRQEHKIFHDDFLVPMKRASMN